MIKQYEGNGVYTLHLNSGRELSLTENEIDEINEEFRDEIEHHLEDLEKFKKVINDVRSIIEDFDERI